MADKRIGDELPSPFTKVKHESYSVKQQFKGATVMITGECCTGCASHIHNGPYAASVRDKKFLLL